MNIQLFAVRVAAAHFEADQQRLNDFLRRIHFVKSEAHFVESEEYWSVLIYHENKKAVKEAMTDTFLESDLTPGALYVLECLKEWRTDKANALNIPKFMICHNSELLQIAFHHPKDIDGLMKIKGFGEKKAGKYGDDIISVLNAV